MKIFDNVQITVLPNGLTVITDHNPLARIVSPRIVVGAGGHHDMPGRLGQAHFLEHMLGYSHPTMSNNEYDDFLQQSGIRAATNFMTSGKEMYMYTSATPERARQWMDVAGDMIGQMGFTADDVEKERGAIVQEMKGKTASNEQFFAQLAGIYPNQAESNRTGGTPEDLSRMTYADLREYQQRFYVGRNMTFISSGALSHEDAVAYAYEKFAHMPEGEPAPKFKAVFRPSDVVQYGDEKDGHEIMVHMRLNAGEYLEREGNLAIVAADLSQRIYHELRTSRALVYSAGASMSYGFHDGLYLSLGTKIAPEKLPEFFYALKDVLDDTVPSLRRNFEALRTSMRASEEERLAHNYQDVDSRIARIHNDHATYGRIREPYEVFEEKYANISLEGAIRAYEFVFNDQIPAMVYSGDTSKVMLPTGFDVANILGMMGPASYGMVLGATSAANDDGGGRAVAQPGRQSRPSRAIGPK